MRLRDEVDVVEVDDGVDAVASAVDRKAEGLGQPDALCGNAERDDLPRRRREQVDIRLVSGVEVFSKREPNGSGEFRGWVRHRDGADPDAISLLMFADSLAPPAFTIFGPLHWVPTIELTVQVRAVPMPGPLQVRLSSRHLTRGVIEEDGEFWDSAGNLVALSRQLAKLRLN